MLMSSLGAGADFVMMGGMLAGHDQSGEGESVVNYSTLWNQLPYIGNHLRKKKFANLEAFMNVFLHFLISAGIFIYETA